MRTVIICLLVGAAVGGGFLVMKSMKTTVTETFSKSLAVHNGAAFGPQNQFTFSLDQNGTFEIDGASGLAWQKSASYKDSAIIRSTKPLPKTYKITAIVGGINYGLENIAGLPRDHEFPEGPPNENGCYLLSITDEVPNLPHTNIWWHQHRKLVIDVDNNVWGHGMPNPIFMVYFDKSNKLNAFSGEINAWQGQWLQAVTYDKDAFYKVEIERTLKEYILRISTEEGKLLKEGRVALDQVWHADKYYEDYLVIGEPHANYYQGSFKIKEITLQY